ncbi:MAG: PilZ domain-containing protein [Treponema sp.]|nr:PilZ domain-containing protein [Treponema sp.]
MDQAVLASGEGKKIFFLYPHSVIRDEMLDVLIMAGFETYTSADSGRVLRLLEKFPGSILFINIDERFTEKEWEAYIRSIQERDATKDSLIGILSYNQDTKLMQKYLMEMRIQCGYIQLKLGVQASTKIILDALAANEARGRRKYIRAVCEDDTHATLNFKDYNQMFHGKILDISSVGIAARIEKLGEKAPNTVLKGVQLKLHGSLVMIDAIIMGKRQDDNDVYILLFDPNRLTRESKLAIHHYIKQCLQKYIDNLKV